jgi:hypothetical protein
MPDRVSSQLVMQVLLQQKHTKLHDPRLGPIAGAQFEHVTQN